MSVETINNSEARQQRFTVVVLGDLGHSPRIINQALSLSTLPGAHVDIVGYKGSPLPAQVNDKENIDVYYISPPPALGPGLLSICYLLFAPIKAFLMLCALLSQLIQAPASDYVLVQNPPAIPTLLVAQLICFFRGSQLIIDWHNFGYSILALKFGFHHPIVKLAHVYEWVFGCDAYAHITVTQAMAHELKNVWKVEGKIVVLHDRAPSGFQKLTTNEVHATLVELEKSQPEFASLASFFWLQEANSSNCPEATLLTTTSHNGPQFRANRPYLLVSSTSWTPDEDFDMFLEALIGYNEQAKLSSDYGRLAVVITGKGPDRAKFEETLAELQMEHVKIILAWLPLELYPRLLGSADLGVSLHASSSGLDLPMKVVDMLGTGLPICALDFNCMGELVSNNENGLLFSSAAELTAHLEYLFAGRNAAAHLENLRRGAAKFGDIRWQPHWEANFKPLVC
ncbi:mannosyltransferase [Entomophthora muscae]|uniref:Mannosyltransferase n=1 Tax=Entomophthora muscae TaxID=34485 RepID=A0ACC2RZ50_9FUNG|nr:mannosyltransferase [Entomophthora muscae]